MNLETVVEVHLYGAHTHTPTKGLRASRGCASTFETASRNPFLEPLLLFQNLFKKALSTPLRTFHKATFEVWWLSRKSTNTIQTATEKAVECWISENTHRLPKTKGLDKPSWAVPPVRLALSGRNSGKIPERPRRKRSQSVSWKFPREYGWDPPSPIIQGI